MRAFILFVALIAAAFVLGACFSYPAFLLTSSFANFAFHRVASRIAMLILAIELVWLTRKLGLRTRADFGFGLPWRRFIAQSAQWMLIGAFSAALPAASFLALGARVMNADFEITAGAVLHVLLIGLSSGIAVALIEETVMRGALHTAIERESGSWAAAALTAPLFAIVHFFGKVRIPPEQVTWHSGFDLIGLSFAPLLAPWNVLDAFLSWLVVGLVLSLTRILTGNIAVAVGLHAGWVIVLRALQLTTHYQSGTALDSWIARFDGLVGFWIVPWGAAIGAILWLTRNAWAPRARSPT